MRLRFKKIFNCKTVTDADNDEQVEVAINLVVHRLRNFISSALIEAEDTLPRHIVSNSSSMVDSSTADRIVSGALVRLALKIARGEL